jgi:hypothetical protein
VVQLAVLGAGLFLGEGSAWAKSRVVLIRPTQSSADVREATVRIRAELASAGFEVVEVDGTGTDARSSVERTQATGAVAAILVASDSDQGAAADVWVSDRITGKTAVRHVETSREGTVPSVLAVRALELLRASLLEAEHPPKTSRPPEVPRDVSTWVRATEERPTRLSVVLGVGALISSGGLGAAVGPDFRIGYRVLPRIDVRIGISGPCFGSAIEAPEGRANVRQERIGVELTYDFLEASAVSPYAAVGVGAYHAQATGQASAGYRASEDSSLAAVGALGAGLRADLGSAMYLLLEASALVFAPRPVVVIANREMGDTGRPAFAATLGLGARL